MPRINFALVVHNHQPVDNDDSVIEEVYKRSYLPFLECLSSFSRIKANLHYSGYLLEWLETNHPEFIALLRKMVNQNQIEIIGGGYYEPIIPTIPKRDGSGQIRLLSKKIKLLFGTDVRGFWTAERVWEPQSPETLSQCGIKYTILDDTMFNLAGLSVEDCQRPYLVESRGSVVTVFPLLKDLRYFIPFKPVARTISLLKSYASNLRDDYGKEAVVVFADDGEKFGAWPTTYEAVYKGGWLRAFFNSLLESEKWLELVRLSDYLDKYQVKKKTYLPSASYEEMMGWSLPIIARGDRESRGSWRLFLSKYPESGRLYSKMISVSLAVSKMPREKRQAALRELWKGQFNDVFWHGVFGGLYFSKFRNHAYHHLINAQKMAELAKWGGANWTSVKYERPMSSGQFFFDTKELGIRMSSRSGGTITELDYKPKALNLFDSLTRRKEIYHSKIRRLEKREGLRNKEKIRSIHEFQVAKEKNLKELLVYDRYEKASFIDYFLSQDTKIDHFLNQTFSEVASFAGERYTAQIKKTSEETLLKMERRSPIHQTSLTAKVRKELIVTTSSVPEIRMRYDIDSGVSTGEKGSSKPAKFATEINFGSLGDASFARQFSKPKVVLKTKRLEFVYREFGLNVKLQFDRDIDVWTIPVRTVSQSESGFESNLQGVSIIPCLSLQEAGNRRATASFGLTLSFEDDS